MDKQENPSYGLPLRGESEQPISSKRLMEILFSFPVEEKLLGEILLAHFSALKTDTQRVQFLASMSNWAHTKNWAWDILKTIEADPNPPPEVFSFFELASLGERKRPSERKGRPDKDLRDFKIVTAIRVLIKYYDYSPEKAYAAVADKTRYTYETIRHIYRKMEGQRPFKKIKDGQEKANQEVKK